MEYIGSHPINWQLRAMEANINDAGTCRGERIWNYMSCWK